MRGLLFAEKNGGILQFDDFRNASEYDMDIWKYFDPDLALPLSIWISLYGDFQDFDWI